MSIREDIKAFVDGELDAARMDEVRRKLDADPALDAEAAALRHLGEAIRVHARRPEAVGMDSTLRRLQRRRSPLPWRGLSYAAGALVVLVACVFAVNGALGPRYGPASESASLARSEAMAANEAAPESAAGMGMYQAAPSMPAGGDRAPAEMKASAPPTEAMRAAAPRPGGIEPQTNVPPDATRLVIRNGAIDVRVPDVAAASVQAAGIATTLGGYVESASDQLGGAYPTAQLTLRVPSARFDQALAQIASLGEVLRRQSRGEDVTGQVADIEARVKVMRHEEEQLLQVLRATRRVGEILEVRDRLASVRAEIESLDGQRKALRNLASLSAIQVGLSQVPRATDVEPPKDWAGDAWTAALRALAATGQALGKAGIFVLILAPVWVPAVLIVWWLVRRTRR